MGAQYILCHSNTMMKNNIYQPNDIANHISHDDMCFSSPKPRVPAASQTSMIKNDDYLNNKTASLTTNVSEAIIIDNIPLILMQQKQAFSSTSAVQSLE
jgi:hypothetical protein